MGIIIPCIHWIKTTPPNKSNQQRMDTKILMMCLMAFMAFGLSNATSDLSKTEKVRKCVQSCKEEKYSYVTKEKTKKGKGTHWLYSSSNIYKYMLEEENQEYEVFEDCTDFCTSATRYGRLSAFFAMAKQQDQLSQAALYVDPYAEDEYLTRLDPEYYN